MNIFRILLLVGVVTSFIACEKETTTTFEIEILDEICGTAVVKILDSEAYQYGEDDLDFRERQVDHVFYTQFDCEAMAKFNKLARPSLVGLRVEVQIVKEDAVETAPCITCLAIVSQAPATKHQVKVLSL